LKKGKNFMCESWLDKSHRLAKEEFEIPLRKIGFKKNGNSMIRTINNKKQVFRLQWSRWSTRHDNFNFFRFDGDDFIRNYISLGFYYCGEDIVQVNSFINSGNNDFAEEN